MADTKISALTSGAAITGTEEIPMVQSAATVKTTPAAFRTYMLNTASTWTKLQTFTPPANTSGIVVSGASITGTNTTPFADFSGTWNGTALMKGITVTVTDTASDANSCIQDWVVGSASKLCIRKDGSINLWNAQTSNTNFERGFFRFTSNVLEIGTDKGSGGGTARDLRLLTDGTARLLVNTSVGLANMALTVTGTVALCNTVAVPNGGNTTARVLLGSNAAFGVYYGNGAPTVSAGKGSLYMRIDGSSTSTRLYVNTDGATTWTNVTTAA
jgi:hypothetical protein